MSAATERIHPESPRSRPLSPTRAELFADDALVTSTPTTIFLGVGSIPAVKAIMRRSKMTYTHKIGKRMMIPVHEIKGLWDTSLVHDLRSIATVSEKR